MAGNQHSDLVEIVRKGLNPRGHHRLCRVNMPKHYDQGFASGPDPSWNETCNCHQPEIEKEHAALDSLEERCKMLTEQRDSLRAAWNAHMETCPKHATLDVPTMEQIQAWRDAPSGTASA